MNKEELRNKIMELLVELNDPDEEGNGTLFLNADIESSTVSASLRGDMRMLGMAFGNKMETNPDFNRVMMAMFTSFLSNNQEAKAKFLDGLRLSDFSIGIN